MSENFQLFLMTEDLYDEWKNYVQKIMRDIKVGLSIDLFDDVVRISENLGVRGKIEPRVEKTKEIIGAQMR